MSKGMFIAMAFGLVASMGLQLMKAGLKNKKQSQIIIGSAIALASVVIYFSVYFGRR